MLSLASLGFSGCDAVVIGASAGAIVALKRILPPLSAKNAAPIVVVVHLPPNRPSLLPELFGPRCQANVREPNDKDPVAGGTIWFAPADYHLLIERERVFSRDFVQRSRLTHLRQIERRNIKP